MWPENKLGAVMLRHREIPSWGRARLHRRARGYVDRVAIRCGAEVIVLHRRSYEGEDMLFDPLHYLLFVATEKCGQMVDIDVDVLVEEPSNAR